MEAQAASVIQRAMKNAVKTGLSKAGGAVGGFLGSKVGMGGAGKKAGKGVAARLSRILGSGEYTTNQGEVAANSLFKGGGGGSGGPGSFESSTSGIRIKHREYVQDIFATTAVGTSFVNNSWTVNPGLSAVFPYLAQIASNFEQYKFHGLVFEFVSSTSQYGQTALGTYVMAMEYNAAAPAFTTKPQMENSDYAMSARLDRSGMYGVECAKGSQAQEYFYVRAPGQTVVSNLYDAGLMQLGVATTTVAAGGVGINAGSSLGEFWVTYDVELIRPRISVFRPGYYHLRSSGVVSAAPLGPTANQTTISFGSLSGAYSSLQTITFPLATIGDVYMVTYTVTGNTNAPVVYPGITTTGFSDFRNLGNNVGPNTNFSSFPTLAAAATTLAFTLLYQVTSEQPLAVTMTVGLTGVYPGGVNNLDVIITNLGNGLPAASL